MPKAIPLTQGHAALVDEEDFDFLNQWVWRAKPHGNTVYAIREENNTSIYIHKLVAARCGLHGRIDHEDGDGLNNRRNNLREADNSQNMWNRRLNCNSTTGYKGVTYDSKARKFRAVLAYRRRRINLGYFDCSEQAARAYDRAAKRYFGKFANLNFKESISAET